MIASDRLTDAAPAADARLSTLSVIVPVYDEAASVAAVAADFLAVLPDVARRFEIVFVDDGSTDDTGTRVDRLAAAHPGVVHVVRHARNRGYGAALRSGLRHAALEWVFLTDGDGQFPAGELPRLLEPLRHADVVAGYRRRRADPLHRRLSGRGWSWLVRRLFGLSVRDVNCAYKLFRRDALDGVELIADGAAVSAELLTKLARRGCRIAEVPVTHRPRRVGHATGGRPRVVGRAFQELLRLRRELGRPA